MELKPIKTLDHYSAMLKKSEGYSKCSKDLISTLAGICIGLFHAKKNEDTFHCLDVFNSYLLENSLPVPEFLREKLLQITEERIKENIELTKNNLGHKIKKTRIKDELLRCMVNLVIVGASVEKASEIVVLSNANTYNKRQLYKASTMEKSYPAYANEILPDEHLTRIELVRRSMELFSNIENTNYKGSNTFAFWEEIIEKSKGLKIPDYLKGNRRV
ncbi:hypothetical protein [Pseudoalteromonas sp. S2893]|uniref:hypothetical protein n=1 Tax=Pseudoalteromonas sp. S2893 TaxID=579530 RepID=UPI00110B9E79|nr:hypothetical protein [Pseudoalteromonas sp. S2893]TMP14438.1 hypothetical protein CWC04_16595 [Pseudoalteromonas sp. S2893]